MRLVIARCSVDYQGRLSTALPEAVRLLVFKGDGTLLIHNDRGGKPLNWMSAPSWLSESEDDGIRTWVIENKEIGRAHV